MCGYLLNERRKCPGWRRQIDPPQVWVGARCHLWTADLSLLTGARLVQLGCFVFVQSIQFINALPDNNPLMTTYDLAAEYWGDQSVITIVAEDGASIGFLPLSFVQSCGVNTWRYVLDVVHNLVASNIRGFIQNSGGVPVALDSEPQAGT
jgi:hypothetical protein